ncbi:RNA polymerase factor sigma-54 [Athalassotoga saccharophila]|uniref:RNA polymerase factor sigma-54 n=1 Tax=Athalassotoga saccharophila TaxID=1441386 RepID=UPI0013794FE0|nr:RNA polymerase factor sigma-54 [Athalassotoga saccharophila]BBJ27856.1 RNA polymerase sigma-54 factor [Athalassotoga saccharophila]
MGHFINQKLKLKNTLFLSNKMLLSLKLLNMNIIDLEEEIEKIAQENPFIEFEVFSNLNFVRKRENEEEYDIDNYEVENRSLKSHLLDQFYLMDFTKEEEGIFLYLIEMIDDRGFIKAGIDEIAKDLKVDPRQVEKMIEILKSLDPPGIGSRDIKEALLAQTDDPKLRALINLLELLEKDPAEALAKSGMEREEFQETLEKLKGLNPYPANGFYESLYTQYVEPDIFISKGDNGFEAYVNERIEIRFADLELYEKMIESGDKKQMEFAKLKYDQAKNLIESFVKRRETLIKFGQIIAKKEEEFFNGGKLVPLKVGWIANEIGVNPSTVTRIISSKYVKTPNGIYPLKYFFERFIYKNEDKEISREEVKEKIARYVKEEDKNSPLSDFEIQKKLKEEGIDLSRRVVAKYREELGIPSSSRRRLKSTPTS